MAWKWGCGRQGMSEPTHEHEISLSPVSCLGVSLKSASLLPGWVQCSSFQGPKPYKARCGHICSSLIRLGVVVFAQGHYWFRLEKNEHTLGLVARLGTRLYISEWLSSLILQDGQGGGRMGNFDMMSVFFFQQLLDPPPPPSFLMRYILITCVMFLWHQSHIM